jgi:hypothetical protein
VIAGRAAAAPGDAFSRTPSGAAAAQNDSSIARTLMPLLQVLITLIVVGILLWLVNNFIPMAGSIKSILNAVVVICVIVWLLNVFGLMGSIYCVHVK